MGSLEGQSIRSVVVDDDKAIGEVLKELVSGEHISVKVFNDGHEAIAFIKKQPVDIVITDLIMPKVGGLEVLDVAKRLNPDAVVIIVTGHASLETAIEAVRKGAYDYIKKPFKLQEMEIAFNNAVEKVCLIRKNRQLLQDLKDAYDQLLAIKKENNECKDEHGIKQRKIACLNFFSSNLPSLEFFHKANTHQQMFFEELERISRLKKDGLLSDTEFKALKAHMIKRFGISTTH